MTAHLAVAGQGYAEQIAKHAGALNQQTTSNTNQYAGVRKPDLASIFQTDKTESESKTTGFANVLEKVDPVAVQENVTIFSSPVAQSQHKAAHIAHKADVQNYDASAVGAKFGGIA